MTKDNKEHTAIHGCLRASTAVILLAWSTVSIFLMRSFASAVTVSHSGNGNCNRNSQVKVTCRYRADEKVKCFIARIVWITVNWYRYRIHGFSIIETKVFSYEQVDSIN